MSCLELPLGLWPALDTREYLGAGGLTPLLLWMKREVSAAPDLIAHVEASLREVEASFAGAAIAPRLTVLQTELLSGLQFESALFPVFQPKVDMRSGSIIGVEALSRLRPEFGSLSPAQFCGFYENSRRAAEFSRWILDASLARTAHWAALGWPLQVAVNVPPHLLRSRRFADMVHAALDGHGLPGEALQIEITERGAPDLDTEMKDIVAELLERGVSLAVDDFGAGYDSLLTLKELGISVLKLDGWMIRDLTNSARAQHILQSVLEMAARLQVSVVAEGVETAEQADRLRALGCDAAQGYLFARPMQEAELLSWLQTPCRTFPV